MTGEQDVAAAARELLAASAGSWRQSTRTLLYLADLAAHHGLPDDDILAATGLDAALLELLRAEAAR